MNEKLQMEAMKLGGGSWRGRKQNGEPLGKKKGGQPEWEKDGKDG